MKKIILVILVVIVLIALGFYLKQFIILNPNDKQMQEYVPQEEISDEQLRKTIVSLFFKDAETGELREESRLIDAKNLLVEPYKELVELLIAGPQTDKLKEILPKETKVNRAELKGDTLEIDFASDAIKEMKPEEIKLINEAILKTMTNLSEINNIKIWVNGKEAVS